MNDPTEPIAWVFTGIPGAGKTTTARALATRLPRSVHIEGDRLFELVVSGRVGPGELPPSTKRTARSKCASTSSAPSPVAPPGVVLLP
ncbi:MAG: AAA family ATPase [Armatimonadota bacterium]